jgi:hypothetical protein
MTDHLDYAFDVIVGELKPGGVFFPQPKQDVQEVFLLIWTVVSLLLLKVLGDYLG